MLLLLQQKKWNPDVKFKIIWAYTWYDPDKEAAYASALIRQGADIIMQHTYSSIAIVIAEKIGIYAFGQASDIEAVWSYSLLVFYY